MSKLLEEPRQVAVETNEAEAVPIVFNSFPRIALRPLAELSDDDFLALCNQNEDLRFEKSAYGELIIMPPTGGIYRQSQFEFNRSNVCVA